MTHHDERLCFAKVYTANTPRSQDWSLGPSRQLLHNTQLRGKWSKRVKTQQAFWDTRPLYSSTALEMVRAWRTQSQYRVQLTEVSSNKEVFLVSTQKCEWENPIKFSKPCRKMRRYFVLTRALLPIISNFRAQKFGHALKIQHQKCLISQRIHYFISTRKK